MNQWSVGNPEWLESTAYDEKTKNKTPFNRAEWWEGTRTSRWDRVSTEQECAVAYEVLSYSTVPVRQSGVVVLFGRH